MIHVRRGGSAGTPKDKEERFVPAHRQVAELLGPAKKSGPVFSGINERRLLKRLKHLCTVCEFERPRQYKLHSFRHHFASLCANHQVAYPKALAWLGHSSSQMLKLYYHLHDDDSQAAMMALAQEGLADDLSNEESANKGNLRATGQSKIEKLAQVPEFKEFVKCLSDATERAGFKPALSAYLRLQARITSSAFLAKSYIPRYVTIRYYSYTIRDGKSRTKIGQLLVEQSSIFPAKSAGVGR